MSHPAQEKAERILQRMRAFGADRRHSLDVLQASVDESSEKNRSLFIAFIGVLLYFLVSTFSITDRELFLPTGTIVLPIINVAVPLRAYGLVAPLALLVLHFNILFNLAEHSKKLHTWLKHPDQKAFKDNERYALLKPFVFNVWAKERFDHKEDGVFTFDLLGWIIMTLLSALPLLLFLSMLWVFSQQQNVVVAGLTFLFVVIDVMIQLRYWPMIVSNFGNEIRPGAGAGRFVWFIPLIHVAVLIAAFRFLMTGMVVLHPTAFAANSPYHVLMPFLPTLNLEGQTFRTLDATTDVTEQIAMDKAIREKERGRLGPQLTAVHACSVEKAWQPTRLEDRNLIFANLNNTMFCNGQFIDSDLRYATFDGAIIAGEFTWSDLSATSWSETRIQRYTSFLHSDLSRADFHYTIANHIDFTLTDFEQAVFNHTEVANSLFLQSHFNRSVFKGVTTATRANFMSADFSETEFYYSMFFGVDLRDAMGLTHTTRFHESGFRHCLTSSNVAVNNHHLFADSNCKSVEGGLLSQRRVFSPDFLPNSLPNTLSDFSPQLAMSHAVETVIGFSNESRHSALPGEFSHNTVMSVHHQLNDELNEMEYYAWRYREEDMNTLVKGLVRVASAGRSTTLDLSNMGLTHLPDELFRLKHIEQLILTNNKLSDDDFHRIELYFPNLKDVVTDESAATAKQAGRKSQ